VVLLLALASCAVAQDPPRPWREWPPFRGCLVKPPLLPAVAEIAEVRARHDKLDKLYDDCAERLRRVVQDGDQRR
jgi:hypothetical protein